MVSLVHAAVPLFVVGLSGFLLSAVVTLPHPYDGLRVAEIPLQRQQNLVSFPADFESGPVKMNGLLRDGAVRLYQGRVQGSEGVAVSADGKTLYMLDRYGYLHTAATSDLALRANATYIGPGRPLGFHATADGKLLVCDSLKGLVEVDVADSSRGYRVLANHHGGAPLHYANDLDVCPKTGKVYFTASTEQSVALNPEGYYDTMRSFILNLLRGDASGRVLSYDRDTGAVELVQDDIWFANGVAVSADGSFVYYCETSQFRVLRKCLVTGAVEVVIDRLPAYPDGLSRSPSGTFWVSLVAPVSPLSAVTNPALRTLASLCMGLLKKMAKPQGLVIEIAADGAVLQSLGDPKGETVYSVSSATQVGKRLYLGNLNGDFVSYYDLV